jgi:hypothetical protein
LRNDVYKAINDVASENKRPKISNHIFIVKYSELSSSWQPQYYDWESSAELLIHILEKKQPLNLIPYIQSLYNGRNKNGVSTIKERVYIKDRYFTWYTDVVHTINSEFIKQILIKLDAYEG